MTKQQRAAHERMMGFLRITTVAAPLAQRPVRRNYQRVIDRFPGVDIDAIHRHQKYAKP